MANSINKLLFRYFIGLSVMFGTWIIVILLRNFGPVTFFPLETETVTFLFVFLLASFFGFSVCFLIPRSTNKLNFSTQPRIVFNSSFNFIILCVLIYPIVASYDFFIVKNGSLSAVSEVRHSDHLTGPRNSLIGAVGAILSGAPPIALALLLSANKTKIYYKNMLYFFIFFGFASTFLSGGRNSFFIGVLFVYFYYLLFLKTKSIKIRSRLSLAKIFLYFALVLGFLYSMKMFVDRYVAQGMDPSSLIDYLSHEYDVDVYRIEFFSQTLESAYIAFVYLVFYITHAFTSIDQYFSTEYCPFFLGAYNFPQLSRFIDLLFSTQSFVDVNDKLLVNGAYLTLPGSLYLDFGYVGSIIFGSIFSATLGFLTRNLNLLTLTQRVIYAYLCVAAVFSPIYSVFGMGNGFSIMVLIVVLIFISLIFGKVYKL